MRPQHGALLLKSGVFDCAYYAAEAGISADDSRRLVAHYLKAGARGGLNPHPLFDTRFYLQRNPDVAKAGVNPLVHYLLHGAAEGRDPGPLFDTRFYLAQNAAVARSGVNPLAHYVSQGAAEGRSPSPLFDAGFYLEAYPEARGANPLVHYLISGGFAGCDPSPLFDSSDYLERNPDVAAAGINPLVHYLLLGAAEGRDPNPYFDTSFYVEHNPDVDARDVNPLVHFVLQGCAEGRNPHPEFDVASYLALNPDVAASGGNPLAHYLRWGCQEGRPTRLPTDYMARWRDGCALDPAFGHSIPNPLPLGVVRTRRAPAATAFGEFVRRVPEPFDYLLLVSVLTRSHAARTAANFASYLSQVTSGRSVVGLVTDGSDLASRDWFPPDVRLFTADELGVPPSRDERADLITHIVVNYKPRLAHNVDSAAAWTAFDKYGRPLSRLSDLAASASSYDYGRSGARIDPASRFLGACLPHLTSVVIDNDRFKADLIRDLALMPPDSEKLAVVYQPVRWPIVERVAPRSADRAGSIDVLWAGSLGPQRKPDVFARIAAACPWATFHVFGSVEPGQESLLQDLDLPNITRHGGYASFGECLLGPRDCFLLTSGWDGLPHVLLEALAGDLPVVAPDVGGIRELIDQETGYLVPEPDDVASYRRCLEEIRTLPETARDKVRRAQDRLRRRHSWDSFATRLDDLGFGNRR